MITLELRNCRKCGSEFKALKSSAQVWCSAACRDMLGMKPIFKRRAGKKLAEADGADA